jgi:hypothetical protein
MNKRDLRIKEHLKNNPMYLVGTQPVCERCGGKDKPGRKKMCLAEVCNYTNVDWHICSVYKETYN